MTVDQVDKSLVEQLIKTLEQNPSLRAKMARLFSPFEFVKRDELAEVIKEIRELRVEHSQRFEAMDRRFEAVQKQMDERFEAAQKQMDKRFDAMDRRFEAMQKQIDANMQESRERFEASERRFEAMQKQIDANMRKSDERFEVMQKQIDEHMQESRERFEAMQKQIDRRFEDVTSILVAMQADIADISGKYGKRAEDAVRKILTKVLEAEGIETARISQIQVRDVDGSIFGKDYATDIDIYYEGKQTWIIEYKGRAKREDIIHLNLVARLLRKQYKIDPNRVIMVALNINDDAVVLAKDMNIEVIHGISANPTPLTPPSP
ncbi:MAG: hypothetical protein K9W43_04845 [Candidatus Thorarchaeota archaeon]|nr:hypothetical protein [Candidatus Thorarchaeota archaeon]